MRRRNTEREAGWVYAEGRMRIEPVWNTCIETVIVDYFLS
jgi:hypothetical protein